MTCKCSVLNHSPFSVLKFIATIYNRCITNNYFPNHWNVVKSIMLSNRTRISLTFKTTVQSAYQILLLGFLKKIQIKLFNSELTAIHAMLRHTESNTLPLFENRKGFGQNVENWAHSKLTKVAIPAHFIQILHSYPNTDTSQKFTAILSLGDSHPGRLLQGGLLAPTLFNIYMNNIPSTPNGNNVAVQQYAHDTNVTVHSSSIKLATSQLNNVIKMLETRFGKCRIKITVSKYSIIIYRTAESLPHQPSLTQIFHTHLIGQIMSNTLASLPTLDLHTATVSVNHCKANHRLGQLYLAIDKTSHININLALTL